MFIFHFPSPEGAAKAYKARLYIVTLTTTSLLNKISIFQRLDTLFVLHRYFNRTQIKISSLHEKKVRGDNPYETEIVYEKRHSSRAILLFKHKREHAWEFFYDILRDTKVSLRTTLFRDWNFISIVLSYYSFCSIQLVLATRCVFILFINDVSNC